MQHKLLINGELVSGEGEKQPVYNPATGDVLLEIAEASAEQVNAAVRAADAAFAEWGQTTPKARAECLLKLADVIEENGQVFAELESRNCGKPLHSAFNDEIPAIVDVFRFFAGAARCLNGLAAGEYLEGHTSMIRRDPLGVVASIAPWNYPLMMAAWKLAPALAAGNCVVLKPSEITPLTALKLAELAKDIFPAGVINVLFGRGKTVGDPLTGHPKVRMVSLTGSIATGEHIISHTAPSIKRTHMELGGKAPVIVFDDADIEAVVEGVRTFGYYNAGQDCTAACRIYAQKGIYDTLVEKLGAAVATLKSGSPDDESTELGPLSSLAHLERVSKAVEEAKATGHIKVITGGDKVSLFDAQNAVAVIQDAAGGKVDCIFGIAINEQLGDAIIVTVIATGFEEPKPVTKKRSDNTARQESLYTQPTVKTPVNAGVVTSVEETSQDDQIPNFFFNR